MLFFGMIRTCRDIRLLPAHVLKIEFNLRQLEMFWARLRGKWTLVDRMNLVNKAELSEVLHGKMRYNDDIIASKTEILNF